SFMRRGVSASVGKIGGGGRAARRSRRVFDSPQSDTLILSVARTRSLPEASPLMAPAPPPGRLALLVGGGPAPGLNGVISSVTIEAIEQGIEVIGFQDG